MAENKTQLPDNIDNWKSFWDFLKSENGKKIVSRITDEISSPYWYKAIIIGLKLILIGVLVWFIYFLVLKNILDKITFSLILGAVIGHLLTKYFDKS